MNSLHTPSSGALERVRVVLVRPSHPGNVGACARAMRVMGLRELALVAPREPGCARHPEALAFASGAHDVLAASRTFDSLEAALADATLVLGVSAGSREFGPEPMLPEQAAGEVLAELAAHPSHRVAIVFGTERTGLSVAEVSRCQKLCTIPGDPDYCSLNLSQAVQLIAYVLRRAAIDAAAAGEAGTATAGEVGTGTDAAAAGVRSGGAQAGGAQPHAAEAAGGQGSPRTGAWATQAEIEGFFAHFERALVAIGYLDPKHPKKLMPRMRRLFGRTRLESEEVQLLRGVCKLAEDAGRAWTARPGRRSEEDEGSR